MKWKLFVLAVASIFLAACGGSPGTPPLVSDPIPEIPGEGRAGTVYNIFLDSDVDGERIAFTVIEPDFVQPNVTVPLVLHSHGYGGSREKTRPNSGILGGIIAAGMGILSLDERGSGESGGEIRILDPAFEGQDWLQVLDWAEENLEWLRFENTSNVEVASDAADANPVIGASGGSYGGGYQHLIYAIDPKHRLDAIAPDMTWNDLRYSLFSGRVFKSQWATLLSALGSAPPNTQSQEVQEGLVNGLSNNTLTPEQEALLYENSFASHCADDNAFTTADGLQPIDAFYTQSAQDTLFNFNDAHRNYLCTSALGGDVRIFVKSRGHGLDNGDSSDVCGGVTRIDAEVAWFSEKLLHIPNAADIVPDVCLQLSENAGDSVATVGVQVGNNDAQPVVADVGEIVTGSGGTAPTNVVIYDGAVSGANVLAGVPTINIDVHVPILGGEGPAAPESRADPIIFVGVGVREGANGTVKVLHSQMAPFRGYFTNFDSELIGVFERVTATQQVVLIVQGAFDPQYTGSSTQPGGSVDVTARVRLPLVGDLPSIESQQP